MAAAQHGNGRRALILVRNVALVLLTLIVTLIGVLILFIMTFDVSGYIQRTASERSGREVTLDGNVDIHWSWRPRLTAHGIKVGNVEGSKEPYMFSADQLVISVDGRNLLRGRVVIPELVLVNPDIVLEKNAEGDANWEFSDNPEGKVVDAVTPDDRAEVPMIGRLVIKDGRLRYRDVPDKIDLTTKISTATGALPADERITLAGNGTHQGKPFKLDLTGGSILTLKETDEPYPLKVDAKIGATRIQVNGTMMDPLQLKGLNLQMTVQGKNAADLFPIFGIALPPTPAYKVSGRLGMEDKVWKFTGFKGKMGNSDLRGNLTWDTRRKRPMFTARFTSNRLDFKDLGGLVGAKPGAAKPDGRVLPNMPLDISRLAAMDADVTFTGKKVISQNLPLDDFLLKVKLNNRLLKIQPVKFGTARGEIAGNMTINARKEPVRIDGDFKFRKLSLRLLFQPLEKALDTAPSEGFIGGTAQLKGTGKSLREMLGNSNGTIGLGMEGGQLSNLIVEILGLDVAESLGFLFSGDKPVPIRCVIAHFDVTKGVARSKALVIDTTDSAVHGEGTINLKNETLDLRLETAPKDPSILSLRTPITIGGTLGKPAVGIAAEGLAARAAIGAALGAAFPPAALLAFIEPGLGEDSNCVGMLREMNRDTGKNKATDEVPSNR